MNTSRVDRDVLSHTFAQQESPKRGSVLLLACLCALATGLVLLALAQELTGPAGPIIGIVGRSSADVALVRRFYDAANAVLATGDATLLAETVAPDLTEHPARPGVTAGRAGFVRALLSLRVTFPDLTLAVDDMRAAGDGQVLVRVHAESAGSGVFLGRPVPSSLSQWGPLEVWRIEDGRLVERWGSPDPVALLPLGQVPLSVDTLGPGRRRATVTRLTAEPGATLAIHSGPAVRVFAIEVGIVTVAVRARSGGPVSVTRGSATPVEVVPGASVVVAVGDILITAPEADYTLGNADTTPAVAVVVVVSNLVEGSPVGNLAAAASWAVASMPEVLGGALPSPLGFGGGILAANVELELPTQPILEVGWVVLEPAATLTLPPGDGPLLAVGDGGQVDLTPLGGASPATLVTGEVALLSAEVGSTWRASDDALATVLILAVTRSESPATGTDHPSI